MKQLAIISTSWKTTRVPCPRGSLNESDCNQNCDEFLQQNFILKKGMTLPGSIPFPRIPKWIHKPICRRHPVWSSFLLNGNKRDFTMVYLKFTLNRNFKNIKFLDWSPV